MKRMLTLAVAVAVLVMLFAIPVYAFNGRGNGGGMGGGCGGGGGMATIAPSNGSEYTLADVDAIVAARKAYVDELVANGTITQAKADSFIESYRARVEYCIENGLVGSNCGRGTGRGMNSANCVYTN